MRQVRVQGSWCAQASVRAMNLPATLATLALVIACAVFGTDPAPLHKAVMSDGFTVLILALIGALIVCLVVLWPLVLGLANPLEENSQ